MKNRNGYQFIQKCMEVEQVSLRSIRDYSEQQYDENFHKYVKAKNYKYTIHWEQENIAYDLYAQQ